MLVLFAKESSHLSSLLSGFRDLLRLVAEKATSAESRLAATRAADVVGDAMGLLQPPKHR